MKKLTLIILGWYTFLFGKRTVMSRARLDICMQCKNRKGYFCGICFCELHAKASIAQESCPIKKWPGDLTRV